MPKSLARRSATTLSPLTAASLSTDDFVTSSFASTVVLSLSEVALARARIAASFASAVAVAVVACAFALSLTGTLARGLVAPPVWASAGPPDHAAADKHRIAARDARLMEHSLPKKPPHRDRFPSSRIAVFCPPTFFITAR